MNTFLRNTISKLYNPVSAPAAATRDAFTERLQSVRDTASLFGIWIAGETERHCRKRSRRGRKTNSDQGRRQYQFHNK